MGQTFLTIQQELADRLGLDQTVTANATKLQRWINLSQQDIASRQDWSFLEDREIIQTTLQKTAGTITTTNGSTSITGSGTAFTSTDARSFIQPSNSTNWYEISSSSSATALTLAQPITEASASGIAYKINQVYYDFSVSVDRVLDVRQTNTPYKLTNLGYRTVDLYDPDMQNLSAPTAYYLFRIDPSLASTATKQLQISFYPIADAQYNMECRFIKVPVDLSASGDIPLMPQKWIPVLIDGAEWLGCKHLNDAKESQCKQTYEYGIQRMIEEELSLRDHHPVIEPFDSTSRSLYIPFPSTFEQPR